MHLLPSLIQQASHLERHFLYVCCFVCLAYLQYVV